MSIFRQFLHEVRKLTNRRSADSEVADEVENYVAEAQAEFEACGLSPEEAARAARVRCGNRTGLSEQVRSYGWENVVSGAFAELRYTFRRLCSNPTFTLVSVGVLALGLGATTAIFSVINGVLLKPLPYLHPEQLVSPWLTAPRVKIADLNMAPSVYFTMKDEGSAFQAVSMWTGGGIGVTGTGHPERVQALFATHELLPILGVTPQLGRFFNAADDKPKGERTAMLSDSYWRSHYGGNPAILGRRIILDGNPHTIIGILPRSFEFMDRKADLLIPLQFDRATLHLGNFSYQGVGRLKPGVTMQHRGRPRAYPAHGLVALSRSARLHNEDVRRCRLCAKFQAPEGGSGG